ncbi:MAG: hypothetical protein HFE83_03180 [Lachnospiraceae bacterium]|jgi:benzoyl-CoA reductase/2-hydroxyglutaryl-CoA dehydratase subunit BcrC/BadD/HgdB|nr:hypothetical protein [Lachnospiraceae bacterium]
MTMRNCAKQGWVDEIADLPLIRLGLDMQMRDFGQVSPSLQAFAAMMEENE